MQPRRLIRSGTLLLALVLTLFSVSRASAEDSCGAIIAQGTNDSIVLSTRDSFQSEATDWFCSDSFAEHIKNSKMSAGITIPIDGIPVGFSFGENNASSHTVRKAFCSRKDRKLSTTSALSLAASVTSQPKVDAWLQCMKLKLQPPAPPDLIGLRAVRAGGDKFVILTATWNPVPYSTDPKTVKLHLSPGLTCATSWGAGTSVSKEGISTLCERTQDDSQTAILETNVGFFHVSIPPSKCGKLFGEVQLVETFATPQWSSIGTKQTTLTTGNHHCSKNCKGEPTRTNYRIDISVPADEMLSGPTLTCIAGPCGGWNTVHYKKSDGPTRVVGSFDVWTLPTTWKLTANWFRRTTTTSLTEHPAQQVVYGKSFVVTATAGAQSALLKVKRADGATSAFIAGTKEAGDLKWMTTAQDAKQIHYTYSALCE